MADTVDPITRNATLITTESTYDVKDNFYLMLISSVFDTQFSREFNQEVRKIMRYQ